MEDSTKHQELLLLYQITVNDLSYFKSNQWSVTNHCFLLYAALAGTSQIIGSDISTFDLGVLTLLILGTAFSGILIICRLENSIEVRDARLKATRDELSDEFKKAWAAKEKEESAIKVVWFLYTAMVIGALIVCRIIYV